MARAALRPCTYPGCGELTERGRCEKHQRKYQVDADRRKPGERRAYDLRLWRGVVRPAKLRRDPLCEDHLERGAAVPATDVDHRDGDQWNWAEENLRSLCHPCHSSKTARQDGAFGREVSKGEGGSKS